MIFLLALSAGLFVNSNFQFKNEPIYKMLAIAISLTGIFSSIARMLEKYLGKPDNLFVIIVFSGIFTVLCLLTIKAWQIRMKQKLAVYIWFGTLAFVLLGSIVVFVVAKIGYMVNITNIYIFSFNGILFRRIDVISMALLWIIYQFRGKRSTEGTVMKGTKWWLKFIIMCLILYSTQVLILINISPAINGFARLVSIAGWLLFLNLWSINYLSQLITFSIFCFSEIGLLLTGIIKFDLDIIKLFFEGLYLILVIYGFYSAHVEFKKKIKQFKAFQKAYTEFVQGNYDQALKQLNSLKENNEENIDINRLIGLIYLEKGDIKKGIKEFELALGKKEISTFIGCNNCAYAYLYRNLAIAYNRLDRKKEYFENNKKAIEFFGKIEKMEKDILRDYIDTLKIVAKICYDNMDYQKAKFYLEKITNIDPEDKNIKYDLACLLYKMGNLNQAQSYFHELELNAEGLKKDIYYWLILINSRKGLIKKMYEYLILGLKESSDFYISYKWPDNIFGDEDKKFLLSYLNSSDIDKDKNIYNTVIFLLFELNETNDIEKNLSEMESRFKDLLDIDYWNIVLALKTANYEKAKSLYFRIASKKPDFLDLYDWEEVSLRKEEVRDILLY